MKEFDVFGKTVLFYDEEIEIMGKYNLHLSGGFLELLLMQNDVFDFPVGITSEEARDLCIRAIGEYERISRQTLNGLGLTSDEDIKTVLDKEDEEYRNETS